MIEPKPAGWLIQKMDGLKPVFQKRLSITLQRAEIIQLLKCLAAQDLTPNEILGASLRKRMKDYKPLLEVNQELGRRIVYSIGENPHYVAALFTEREFGEVDLS